MANLSNILVYVGVLSSSTSIRLTQVTASHKNKNRISSLAMIFQLISQIFAFMFWSGGFIYLFENQGDPFHDYTNARDKGEFRFADILWYLIITASTIGYGDYFPVTDLGKIFAIFYISSELKRFLQFTCMYNAIYA